jgi:hypothetical protein
MNAVFKRHLSREAYGARRLEECGGFAELSSAA